MLKEGLIRARRMENLTECLLTLQAAYELVNSPAQRMAMIHRNKAMLQHCSRVF